MRGSSTAELIFQDSPVPVEDRVGEEGRGFQYAMDILDSSRIIIAAQCVGIGQAALEAAISHAKARRTVGLPVAENQAIQLMLADMAAEVFSARLVTMHAATLKDNGTPFSYEASIAKLMASETAVRATSRALQIHGDEGLLKNARVSRLFRDARLTTIYEGSSEIQRLAIARQILGARDASRSVGGT
jgi:alkylation response protein AidB-like acyl-CoA dehydrogenase